jgi:hypothetical protein
VLAAISVEREKVRGHRAVMHYLESSLAPSSEGPVSLEVLDFWENLGTELGIHASKKQSKGQFGSFVLMYSVFSDSSANRIRQIDRCSHSQL